MNDEISRQLQIAVDRGVYMEAALANGVVAETLRQEDERVYRQLIAAKAPEAVLDLHKEAVAVQRVAAALTAVVEAGRAARMQLDQIAQQPKL